MTSSTWKKWISI